MEDFKVRLIQEYNETSERLAKLHIMVNKLVKGELSFEPKCSKELLYEQVKAMRYYLDILEERAKIEEIDLKAEV